MDIREIRKVILSAIATDDYLYDKLIFKGGNALDLVYQITNRASLDLDFSLESDFEDVEKAKTHLFLKLREQFGAVGFYLFDEDFSRVPAKEIIPRWGGYVAKFKLIEKRKAAKIKPDEWRNYSHSIGEGTQLKSFIIEISKFEYCVGRTQKDFDNHTCYVYTLPMIAAEKLRAICQKMKGYRNLDNDEPRARDFYDIFKISQAIALDFKNHTFQDLVKNMFEVKEVPLASLKRIEETRSVHARDWPSVAMTIGKGDRNLEFSFYFDFVINQVESLKPLWIE